MEHFCYNGTQMLEKGDNSEVDKPKRKPFFERKQGKKSREAILEYISTFQQEHGFSPSYTEIMEKFDFPSKSSVAYHLDILERQGLVTHVPFTARSVGATRKAMRSCPNCGFEF